MQKKQQFQIEEFQWDASGFLGQGAFGKVYKGKNVKNGQIVAIKVLNMYKFNDQFLLKSLQSEIHIMKKLQSPNVVKIYETKQVGQETYMFLEFCQNGDLRNYLLKNNSHLPEVKAIEILAQLMNGFKELVNLGYIHRDIKPENVLINGQVFKVADFGFATKADISGKQLLQEQVGTPLYMSPQLLQGKPYSAKSDIWSIGMMFYEMIFGKTAWPARDLYSFLENIKKQSLKFPYDKPIMNETKLFITGCLQVEEKNRMGWDQIFQHQIFSKQANSQKAAQPIIQLDQKAKQILKAVQDLVQSYDIPIDQIFQKYDKDHGGTLNCQEFEQLLRQIDPRLNQEETKCIFDKVDISHDGQISLEEFKQVFLYFDFSDINDKAGHIIRDLREIIKNHKLNLQQIFANFDLDKQGTLDYNEFNRLIMIIAPGLKDYEVMACFQNFDSDKNGQISYNEFYKVLSFGTQDSIAQLITQSQLQQQIQSQSPKNDLVQKSQKLIDQLKQIIEYNKLDLKILFKNFDKSNDQLLDLNEFSKFIQIVDKNIPINEIKFIFQQFDKNKDGKISFDEFSEAIKKK